jgi:Ni,Fe-hydrogenase III large subunit
MNPAHEEPSVSLKPMPTTATTRNGKAIPIADVSTLCLSDFSRLVATTPTHHRRIAALFAVKDDEYEHDAWLYVVIAEDSRSKLYVARTRTEGGAFPTATETCPEVQLFEREIAERHGLIPTGHPWLKPVRFLPQTCTTKEPDLFGRDASHSKAVGDIDYYRVEGEEIHEVGVGPVHAGVIEPGHFRFQCHGEQVLHLEISLGYQHRGIERALVLGPTKRTLSQMETVAGDSTIGHATAYCQLLEGLSGCRPSAKAYAVRAIALELERLANHVGDLGALAGDVGFLPTASYCGRLRGDMLNLTAAICGSRFGRTLLRPGGIGHNVDASLADKMGAKLREVMVDVHDAIELLWDSASVQARFEGIGPVSRAMAETLGLVGVAARAAGLERDVRHDHPTGLYRLTQIPMSVLQSGDVFARGHVRWLEIQRSAMFIQEQLASLPEGELVKPMGRLKPNQLIVSLTEGFRGEICHAAITNTDGQFSTYKIYDASFHNWHGLAIALRNQQISDFPICNKSFNLSYCGHDL